MRGLCVYILYILCMLEQDFWIMLMPLAEFYSYITRLSYNWLESFSSLCFFTCFMMTCKLKMSVLWLFLCTPVSLLQNGWAPLHVACFYGHYHVVRILFAAKAFCALKTNVSIIFSEISYFCRFSLVYHFWIEIFIITKNLHHRRPNKYYR